jgi:hypothetical protein
MNTIGSEEYFKFYDGESEGEPGEGGRKVESVGVKKDKESNLEERLKPHAD